MHGILAAEQREHWQRNDRSMVARPGQHTIVRDGARTQPLDIAAVRLDRRRRVVRIREHRDERRHAGVPLDGDAGVVNARGRRRRRRILGHDSVDVPDRVSCG
jgi:hypothetical protein